MRVVIVSVLCGTIIGTAAWFEVGLAVHGSTPRVDRYVIPNPDHFDELLRRSSGRFIISTKRPGDTAMTA